MSIALIATTSKGSVNAADVQTNAIDTTGASILIVGATSFNASATITDFYGNTWLPLTEHTASLVRTRFFYAKNPTVGTGHWFKNVASYASIAVVAYSGVDTTAPFDQENGATGTGTTLSTGSVTPSTDNQVVVALEGWWMGGDNPTINQSFSSPVFTNFVANLNWGIGISYLIQTTATAKNPTWTLDGSNSDTSASIATFKAASGGSTVSGTGTANADSTASGIGTEFGKGVGTASATSTANGIGSSLVKSVATASGTSTASALSASVATANATSTATGVGAELVIGTGTASGDSSASGVGVTLRTSTATANATSTATGVGLALVVGSTGTASGDSTALGVGASVAQGTGTALGDSTASGITGGRKSNASAIMLSV